MRIILTKEMCNEKPNSQALGAFNNSISRGSEAPESTGFKKAPISELINKLNEKSFARDYKFKEWIKGDIHRIYVNGGSLYNTGKVQQNAYIDAKTGKVTVFTNSNQPMNWNISQSKEASSRLEKYGRYIRRFKE